MHEIRAIPPFSTGLKISILIYYIYEVSYFQTGTRGGVPELIHAQLGAPEELDRKIGFYAKPWSLDSFTNKD